MNQGGHRLERSSRIRALGHSVCIGLIAATLAAMAPTANGAEATPPSVGGVNGENLSIAIPWGLGEEVGAQIPQNSIGTVGAPFPFIMPLMDNGNNRLFIFIQRRVPGHPYCAETPAQLTDAAEELTGPAGDPTIAGPAY